MTRESSDVSHFLKNAILLIGIIIKCFHKSDTTMDQPGPRTPSYDDESFMEIIDSSDSDREANSSLD